MFRSGPTPVLVGVCVCVLVSGAVEAEERLFTSHDELRLVLETDMRTLISDRESRPRLSGVLRYREPDGVEQTVPLRVRPRGKSRLRTCGFPPLRFDFKRSEVESTLFHGQRRLKLVTHCKSNNSNRRYLRQEYLIYRAYMLLTEASFRVRAVTIEYRDAEGKRRPLTESGFFIESTDSVAERLNLPEVSVRRIDVDQMEPEVIGIYNLFQFFIGNTDWSVKAGPPGADCCHNTKAFGSLNVPGGVTMVPYDFDQAGLINKPDALPSKQLPIRNVTQRLYRGFCAHNDAARRAAALFSEKRADLDTLFADSKLQERSRKRMKRYTDAFYTIVNNPTEFNKRIVGVCRNN